MEEFKISYVFGFTPLQQYLVEFDKGRLQVLPFTWNSEKSCWYNMVDSLYKDENITSENWLHWTNQAQNWNSMCADCHSTNLKKEYNPKTKSYNTSWSEIDVSCEACHGAASKHIEWANLAEYARQDIENFGLEVKTSNVNNFEFVDQCARCHSRRTTFSDYYPSDASIYNHLSPNLPTEPNYFIDGQIKDEDYVYGSFTQSEMYMHDVQCNDCHNSHSCELLFEKNELCLQCHKAEDYDTPKHHFHKFSGEEGDSVVSESGVVFQVGEGAECINCHMHGRYFMGVDYRRDHSFRIPRPDLSEKIGTPNACVQCHAEENNEWAQSYIIKWYGESRKSQYGELFFRAQNGDTTSRVELKKIANNELYSSAIRATAIEYLGRFQQLDYKFLYNQLLNIDPKIRLSALRVIPLNSVENFEKVIPLLNDETLAVRMELANKLSGLEINQIPPEYQKAFVSAVEEYIKTLEYNSDFPMGKYSLGNIYYNLKQYEKAEGFYLAVLEQDKELYNVNINLAYLYNTTKQYSKADNCFSNYLEIFPEDGEILFAYGLFLSERGDYKNSLEYLKKAQKISPNNSRIEYNVRELEDFINREN